MAVTKIGITITIDNSVPSPTFTAEFEDGFIITVERGDEEHGDAGEFVAWDDSGMHKEFGAFEDAVEYAMKNVAGAISGELFPASPVR